MSGYLSVGLGKRRVFPSHPVMPSCTLPMWTYLSVGFDKRRVFPIRLLTFGCISFSHSSVDVWLSLPSHPLMSGHLSVGVGKRRVSPIHPLMYG